MYMVAFFKLLLHMGYCQKGVLMNIGTSWKEALRFLIPQNLKPFLLVTGKTIIDIYKAINKPLTSRGNWLVILILILLVGLTNLITMFHLLFISTILLNGIRYTILFMFLLGMRPSVGIKDKDYFYYYCSKYWYLFIATICFGILYEEFLYVIPLLLIFYILFLLFVFDSDGSVRALVPALINSGKMILYNFPIFFLLFLLFVMIGIVLDFLVGFALGYFGGLTSATLLYIVFTPIYVACITNLYIKLVHSQSTLYFQQPE